ncbi:MAG: bifunctional DNA-formamidopyrimidine glycosylase/DNA-(apurinic or apyrimidinic site) lyase [Caldimicrobium sp.]
MPELPEVETIKRDLVAKILGAQVIDIKPYDPSFLKRQKIDFQDLFSLKGQILDKIDRFGKYLFFSFKEKFLILHLGLTGALILDEKNKDTHLLMNHLILSFEFKQYLLHLRDIRKFGKLFIIGKEEREKFLNSVAEDALEISYESFKRKISLYKGPLKSFFLNQKFVSGLGNIYTDELLFRAKLSPFKKGFELTEEDIKTLFKIMKELLQEAIKLRGSSIRDYVDGMGQPGRFQERHLVYGKKGLPCPFCGTPLFYTKLNQRGTTYCPNCQK